MKTQLVDAVISPTVSERVLGVALRKGGDFAEIYVEDSRFTHLVLSNQKIHEASPGHDCGAGIRVIDGNFVVYVYTSDLTEKGLIEAAQAASHAIEEKGQSSVIPLKVQNPQVYNTIKISPNDVSIQEKLHVAEHFGKIAFSESDRVSTVRTFYSDFEQKVTIANSKGLYLTDQRNRIRSYMQVVVDGNEQRRFVMPPVVKTQISKK